MNQKKQREWIRQVWTDYSVGVIFALIVVVSVLVKGTAFLSAPNIMNILRNNSIIGIIAIGMTFIIISGGIDLSVGSQVVAIGTVIVLVLEALSGLMPPAAAAVVAVLCGAAAGVLLGGLNGLIVTKGKVPPFIVTLGTMNIFRSVSQHIMRGGGFSTTNHEYVKISNAELFGVVPLPILYFLGITLLMHFISRHTRYGRYVYAIGSNEKAARLSTIDTTRIKLATYGVLGLLVGIAAIVETSRMGSINPTSSANLYEMDAISAVVVGGVSMSGGKGFVIGTFFGVLTIGLINNMMTLVGVPPFLVNAMKGLIIIAAVLLQKKEKTE